MTLHQKMTIHHRLFLENTKRRPFQTPLYRGWSGQHHIVRLRNWQQLLLEFWLADTYVFAHPLDQRAVTCLKNVRLLNIRRNKKLSFQLSHWQPRMDRVVTQTYGRAFQTLNRAFDFLLRLQKLSRVFWKLDRVFEKLCWEFERLSRVF